LGTSVVRSVAQSWFERVVKAGAAVTTEGVTVKWIGAGSVWGVGVAWAAHVACLATVLRHWQALRLAFVCAAVVPCLAPPVALRALGVLRNILAAKGERLTALESGTSGAQHETHHNEDFQETHLCCDDGNHGRELRLRRMQAACEAVCKKTLTKRVVSRSKVSTHPTLVVQNPPVDVGRWRGDPVRCCVTLAGGTGAEPTAIR
jgi:hypothetical protein